MTSHVLVIGGWCKPQRSRWTEHVGLMRPLIGLAGNRGGRGSENTRPPLDKASANPACTLSTGISPAHVCVQQYVERRARRHICIRGGDVKQSRPCWTAQVSHLKHETQTAAEQALATPYLRQGSKSWFARETRSSAWELIGSRSERHPTAICPPLHNQHHERNRDAARRGIGRAGH